MIRSSAVARDPLPADSLGGLDLLAAAELRDYVERLRYQDFVSGASPAHPSAVIAWDVARAKLDVARFRRIFLDRLPAFCAEGITVGWIDSRRIGVVLPSATAGQVAEVAASICRATGIQPAAIVIYLSESTADQAPARGLGFRCTALTRLYRIPTPMWKRLLDVGVASLLVVLLAPLLLAVALLVKVTSRGPVLFAQRRVGHGGKPFHILKFRTMCPDADAQKHLLQQYNERDGLAFKMTDDPRVTPLGRILRRLSLDELPQLFNVIAGDMSLVGPRPLPCSDWKPDSGWVCQRHDVAPGITCTWQVSGRSNISFEHWMQMDLQYIRNRSFFTDVDLLLRTIPAVFSQQGAT